MEIQSFAPVVIPTLCRYEHFVQCIESLERCTWANKTEVYVGLDYPPSEKYVDGWKKICDYLAIKQTNHEFKKLIIKKREYNYGARRNTLDIQKYIFEHYNTLIFTEDDNEFSPCFLDYMNKGFEIYKNDERVANISGYTEPKYSFINDNVLFLAVGNAWGLGLWKEKEEKQKILLDTVIKDTLFSFRKSMKVYCEMPFRLHNIMICYENGYTYGDVRRGCLCSSYGYLQLHPTKSLVRNTGQDGSGLHSGINQDIMKEVISDDLTFTFDLVPVKMRRDVAKVLRRIGLPIKTVRRYLYIVKIAILYIIFRINHLFRK